MPCGWSLILFWCNGPQFDGFFVLRWRWRRYTSLAVLWYQAIAGKVGRRGSSKLGRRSRWTIDTGGSYIPFLQGKQSWTSELWWLNQVAFQGNRAPELSNRWSPTENNVDGFLILGPLISAIEKERSCSIIVMNFSCDLFLLLIYELSSFLQCNHIKSSF